MSVVYLWEIVECIYMQSIELNGWVECSTEAFNFTGIHITHPLNYTSLNSIEFGSSSAFNCTLVQEKP
jgi:hypothetical protein